MSIFGELWDKGKQLAGTGIDDLAKLAGDGLNDVGLRGAAQWVEAEGGKLDSDLSGDAAELQLGQTTDPADLVHGDPAAIRLSASRLKQFSSAFGETATGMRGLDTAHWTGAAADAFRAKFAPHPGQWQDAGDATDTASVALEAYAAVVESAQGQARWAIDLYQQGQQATASGVAAYNQRVAAYNSAANAYNATLAAGQDPGTRPTEPGAFTDPGAALRDQAQQVLSQARTSRNAAASAAAGKINGATSLAPAEPSFWSEVKDDLWDAARAGSLAGDSFSAGVIDWAGDTVKFARTLNPQDPWNQEHPAEYAAGVSGALAGVTQDVVDPQDLVTGIVGTGWGSDPFEALGKLAPNVALAVVTGGAGTAADAGASAAEDVGESAAAEAGSGFRSFSSNSEAAAYGVKTWEQPRAALTSGEIDSLWGYSGEKFPGDPGPPDYKDINGYLRGTSPAAPEVTASIGQIDQALAKGATPEGIQVVRETGLNAFDRPVSSLVGTVQRDPGFLSTALGPDATFDASTPAVVHLDVPEGTPAMYMDGVSQIPSERELLLGRGLSYSVTKVEFAGGRYQIYGIVLP